MLKVTDAKVIWYKDLEDYVKETYGREIDIQRGEYSNDSYLTVTVDKRYPQWFDCKGYGEEYANCVKDWTAGKDIEYFDYTVLLWDMANKGVIEEGEYIITIYW